MRGRQLARVEERVQVRGDGQRKPRLPHYGKGTLLVDDIRRHVRNGGFGEFAPEDFLGPEAMKCLRRMQ